MGDRAREAIFRLRTTISASARALLAMSANWARTGVRTNVMQLKTNMKTLMLTICNWKVTGPHTDIADQLIYRPRQLSG